jgi:hypothetical protein
VPVQPPWRVTTKAHQLPTAAILLQLTVRADAALPLLLHRAQLVLQYGVEPQQDVSAASLQLPLLLQPGATTALTYILAKRELQQGGNTQYDAPACSGLHLEYDVVTTAAAAAAIPVQEVCLPFSSPVLDQQLPAPPAPVLPPVPPGTTTSSPMVRASIGGGGYLGMSPSFRASTAGLAAAAAAGDSPAASPVAGEPSCSSFQYTFQLEFPDLSQSDHDVSIRLLGPYTARLGESLALAWQLTRTGQGGITGAAGVADTGAAGDQGEDEVLCYEVCEREAKGCWAALLSGKGVVRLGRALGSVATVEAVVLPVAAGRCRPPELLVSGLHKARLVSEEEAAESDLVYVYSG